MKANRIFFPSTHFLLFFSKSAQACSVCFGNSDSLQIKAIWPGVAILFGVTGSVLGAIVVLGFKWAAKARSLETGLGQ